MCSLPLFRSSWRHWGCVTPKIITNMKDSFNDADELDGFDDLNDEDQDRLKKAWDDGHVAVEDVPETAKKGDGDEEDEEEEKPKKKGGKKKVEEEDDGKGVFKFEYASSGRSKCKGAFISRLWSEPVLMRVRLALFQLVEVCRYSESKLCILD